VNTAQIASNCENKIIKQPKEKNIIKNKIPTELLNIDKAYVYNIFIRCL